MFCLNFCLNFLLSCFFVWPFLACLLGHLGLFAWACLLGFLLGFCRFLLGFFAWLFCLACLGLFVLGFLSRSSASWPFFLAFLAFLFGFFVGFLVCLTLFTWLFIDFLLDFLLDYGWGLCFARLGKRISTWEDQQKPNPNNKEIMKENKIFFV